jgi:release factor glutamine methyltransferase
MLMGVAPPVEPTSGSYRPTLSADYIEQIRRWHDRAYAEELEAGAVDRTFDYLGLSLVVPPEVMPITPMSHLLGEAVLAEVQPGERVLDMGTGSGVNAILAAVRGARVLAVDMSPAAVAAAQANVIRNGVAERIEVRASDVFTDVDGVFDLIVFDPPFRWFKPRSLMESVMADEGYQALTRFVREVRARLTPGGRILLFFGTSGDLSYLQRLLAGEAFRSEVVAHDELTRDGWKVDYVTFRVR